MAEQPERPAVPAREQLAAWYPEYFLLDAGRAQWMLSTAAAREVERALDRWPRPQWLRFVDIIGARVRVRTTDVRWIQQCTPETYALWRRWVDERRREEGEPDSGPPW